MSFIVFIEKPTFDKHMLTNLTVRAGTKINYTIPCEASPKATATWTCNDFPIVSDNRHEIYTTAYETVFEIPISLRSDSGIYCLTLSNEFGSCR